MEKTEFARIFGLNEADVKKLADLSREAQRLGLCAEPEVGLIFLTDMPIGCIGHDVFIIIDNILFDQHSDAEPDWSPLGDETLVPDWDISYSWAAEYGWKLLSAHHNGEIIITLSKGEKQVTGNSRSGRIAMLEAAVNAVNSSRGSR